MQSDLTESQQIFYDAVHKFAVKELADGAVKRANSASFPWDVAKKCSDMGLLGITISKDDGGIGGSLIDAILAIQAIAEVCPRSADVVQAGNFGAVRTFSEYASDDLKSRFLPKILSGQTIMTLGMTEPEAGSAATELATTAELVDDEYVINGAKIFGTHSGEASIFLVYVRFGLMHAL